MRKRLAIALVLMLSLVAAAPATASASVYSQVLQSYQASGSVPPCRFTSAQLTAALRGIDTYGQQYFADFSYAVQSALAQRAAGACTRGVHPVASAGAPQAPLPPSATSPTDGSVPLPMLLLAGLALLAALTGVASVVMRRLAWEPRWATAWHHAWGEAGYRLGGGLGDAADRWRRR